MNKHAMKMQLTVVVGAVGLCTHAGAARRHMPMTTGTCTRVWTLNPNANNVGKTLDVSSRRRIARQFASSLKVSLSPIGAYGNTLKHC